MSENAKPRSKARHVVVIAAAAIVITLALLSSCSKRRYVRPGNKYDSEIAGASDYLLAADGRLKHAVVQMTPRLHSSNEFPQDLSHPIFLLVDLDTKRCRRPSEAVDGNYVSELSQFGDDYTRTPGLSPAGHGIIPVHRSGGHGCLLGWVPIVGPWLERGRTDWYFYNPEDDSIERGRPVAKPRPPLSGVAGWVPGSDRIAVMATTQRGARAYLVGPSGKTTEVDISGSAAGTGLLNCGPTFVPSKALWVYSILSSIVPDSRSTRSVYYSSATSSPFDGSVGSTIVAPPGSYVMGCSPHAPFVLLQSQANANGQAVICSMDGFLRIRLEIGPLTVVDGDSVGVPDEGVPLTLWNRETDVSIRLLTVSADVFDLSNVLFKASVPTFFFLETVAEFFFTPNGIVTLCFAREGGSESPLDYYEFETGTRRAIPLGLSDDRDRAQVLSIAPDGTSILVRTWRPATMPSTFVYPPTGVITTGKIFLVNPATCELRRILLNEASKPIDMTPILLPNHYTLMADGTILAIEGDNLIRYDPDTDEKRVIVKDLFGMWKRLGREMSGGGK